MASFGKLSALKNAIQYLGGMRGNNLHLQQRMFKGPYNTTYCNPSNSVVQHQVCIIQAQKSEQFCMKGHSYWAPLLMEHSAAAQMSAL